MSAGEALVLAAALIGIVLAGAVLVALRDLRGEVARVQATVDELSAGAATVDDLRAAVTAAVAPEPEPEPKPEPAPLTRVPEVLRTGPVIKAMALGSGTAHVARRLRGNRRNGH